MGHKIYPDDIVGVDTTAPELFGGKTYYVDYEHGNDNNSGNLDNPVKQVNQAITLSNAFQQGETITTGDLGFVRRNRIYIRPWGAAATSLGQYDPVTVVPQHCDIIGLGASVLTNGSGIVAIGTDTDATPALTVGAGGMRGVNFYGIQFRGGGTGTTNVFTSTGTVMRCGLFDCSFYALIGSNAHIGTTGHWAGNTMKRVHFRFAENNSPPDYNFLTTSGVQTGNWWEDCSFDWAATANVKIGATSLSHGSVMKNCSFGKNDAPTDSFLDTSSDGGYFLQECWFDSAATDPLHRTVAGNDAGCIKGKTLITGNE